MKTKTSYPLRRAFEVAGQLACLVCATWIVTTAGAAALAPQQLHVPLGFHVDLVTDAVPGVRALTLGKFDDGKGVVYVGSASAGKVYAVEMDKGNPSSVHTVVSGVLAPEGVAYRNDQLFFSSLNKIMRLDAIDEHLNEPPAPQLVTDRLPADSAHSAKYLGFGPDGLLYFAVGSPCNICIPDDAHGNIQRMNPDGTNVQIVARGIRNSVGFAWSPVDQTLWFSDNGRDMMGDDMPSDELNHVQQEGQDFGFPYCHQGDTPDPEFGGVQHPCSAFVPPVAKLGAHVASLGLRFYTGNQFPAEYRNSIFVAEHGSWNRSRKVGYRVARVKLDARGKFVRQEPFMQGWLKVGPDGHEIVLGRPADVLMMPDGSLLVSDEWGGAIYRVTYGRNTFAAHFRRQKANALPH
jgi:glucose/arabinose dehydrogenase